ncbi:hypothetical protein [Melaminivora sp.]|uniref:hypothetical protein n=1 Tax=Melaminivora sp. TaxID=1933032 RepID=UPI0028AA86DD|nr:hypothetical protein [Melaminivora sp.]
MAVILLEALLALVILLGIVWWTMFAGRKRGELPASRLQGEAPPAPAVSPPPPAPPPPRDRP